MTETLPEYRAEAVHRLFLGIEGSLLYFPLLPLVVVIGLWQHVEHSYLLVWLLAAGLVTPVWQYFVLRRYRSTVVQPSSAPEWGWTMTWPILADGIIWGCAGVFFYVPDSLAAQLLLIVFLIGIPAGSIYACSWWPPSLYANAYVSLLMTAAGLLWRGSPEQMALALGLLIYIGILHQLMLKAHAVAMESIALRFENIGLIDKLRLEKEIAERANQAKSRFLAAASHDLRQPLHAMSLFSEAINERIHYPDVKGIVGNLQHCMHSLESLLESLLDISKIDAGVIDPEVVDFRIQPLIERLRREFVLQAERLGLAMSTECSDLGVQSDPALVERILRNLIANAIRYTPQGLVEVKCAETSQGVLVSVIDSGIGIPADQHALVFEEFVQLGNPARDRTKGLGLGLAIVHRLCLLLGTKVTLESEPGRGSVFSFVLPAGVVAMAEHETLPAQPDSMLEGCVVLVIDDEADVREATRILLQGWGCQVVAAKTAAEAIAGLADSGVFPEAILADYRLRDGQTGIDAIHRICEHFGLLIPAAIVTGDTAPERLQEVRDSGYVLLHKPLRPAKVRVLLQNLRSGRLVRT